MHSYISRSIIEYSSKCLHTKRWYFILHVARCVIISPSFLFSLSQSVWHFFPPHLFLCHSYLLFYATATRWRITPFLFLFFFYFPPPLLCTVSFPSFSLCLSQCDGLSGWLLRCSWSLCKYIYLYSTASLLFSPCCLWVFKCEMAKNKPIEMFTFQVFAFSTFRHLLFTLTQAFKGTKF